MLYEVGFCGEIKGFSVIKTSVVRIVGSFRSNLWNSFTYSYQTSDKLNHLILLDGNGVLDSNGMENGKALDKILCSI